MTACDTRGLSDLRFALEKSMRYHQRRRGFLETCHRAIMFLVVMTGSAAVADLTHHSVLLGGIAALLAAIDLAYAPGSRARDHLILHQRFANLLSTITRLAAPTDENLREWTAERYRIEADEPPVYWALEMDCHNEICFARGQKDPAYLNPLNWQRRMFMQIYRFDLATPR